MTRNAAYIKALRIKAKAEGRCYVCRARPAKVGCSTCQHCLDLVVAKKRELIAMGLCACGRKPLRNTQCCRRCRKRNTAAHVARRQKLIASGTCIRCKAADLSTQTQCRACADKMAERQKRITRARSDGPVRARHCSACDSADHNARRCPTKVVQP